jgi:hypothetical protein
MISSIFKLFREVIMRHLQTCDVVSMPAFGFLTDRLGAEHGADPFVPFLPAVYRGDDGRGADDDRNKERHGFVLPPAGDQ